MILHVAHYFVRTFDIDRRPLAGYPFGRRRFVVSTPTTPHPPRGAFDFHSFRAIAEISRSRTDRGQYRTGAIGGWGTNRYVSPFRLLNFPENSIHAYIKTKHIHRAAELYLPLTQSCHLVNRAMQAPIEKECIESKWTSPRWLSSSNV